jgi:hypothetical protein
MTALSASRDQSTSCRSPRSGATSEERAAACNRCVDIIHRHLCLMNSVCKGVVTESKLKSATIGLLYMIRQGIVVHDLVVLPKIQVRCASAHHMPCVVPCVYPTFSAEPVLFATPGEPFGPVLWSQGQVHH